MSYRGVWWVEDPRALAREHDYDGEMFCHVPGCPSFLFATTTVFEERYFPPKKIPHPPSREYLSSTFCAQGHALVDPDEPDIDPDIHGDLVAAGLL